MKRLKKDNKKTLEKIPKYYLNKLQNPPVTNKYNIENINKVVKLSWTPIAGLKLRQAFKKHKCKTIFKSASNLESLLSRNKKKFYLIVNQEYMNYNVRTSQLILGKLRKRY